jgi:hypothetical protein
MDIVGLPEGRRQKAVDLFGGIERVFRSGPWTIDRGP